MSLFLMFLAQAAAAPSVADFEALQRRTEAIKRAVAETEGERPEPVNGMKIGDFTTLVEHDDMEDADWVEFSTKTLAGSDGSATLTIRCDGKKTELLIDRSRAFLNLRSMMQYKFRVDQFPVIDFVGNMTKDREGFFIDFSMIDDVLEGKDHPFGDVTLLEQLVTGDKLTVRAKPSSEDDLDYIFSLRGFNKAYWILNCEDE